MKNDWFELTRMTRGEAIVIERVRVKKTDIVIEGKFEPAPLSQLSMEEQIFITAFIRSHGSIKEMEALFGISYPTVKSRLNSIAGKLEFVEINPPAPHNEVLALLDKGDISVGEALKKLRGDK
jgi:hypothetical protein